MQRNCIMNTTRKPAPLSRWLTRVLIFSSMGAITACGSGSNNDRAETDQINPVANSGDATVNRPTTDTPQYLVNTVFDPSNYLASPALDGVAGTWMLFEDSKESFVDANTAEELSGMREVSRQIVSITQQGDSAQIRMCNGDVLQAQAGATLSHALSYAATINSPYGGAWQLPQAVDIPMTLNQVEAGRLHGAFDSGALDVTSETSRALRYRTQREVTLVRISSNTEIGGIGVLDLDWSFVVSGNTRSFQQESGDVKCFSESVRYRESGSAARLLPDNFETPLKTLALDTDAIHVTFFDNLHSVKVGEALTPAETAYDSDRKVDVIMKSIAATVLSFNALIADMQEEEWGSFTPATPELLRQQYTSDVSAISGQIVLAEGEVLHANFSLHW